MHIGDQVRKRTAQMFSALLVEYRHQIEEAHCQEEDVLSISFPVKFGPGKHGGIDIEVAINFVKERIKGRSISNVDERQKTLPFSFGNKLPAPQSQRPSGPGYTEGQWWVMRSRRGLK